LIAQTAADEDVIFASRDTTEITSIDSIFYLKFLYSLPEPPIAYADTLILETIHLPFIFNKSRIDFFPLTPPLGKKQDLSLAEKFLPGKLFSDTHNRYYLHKKVYNYIVDNRKDLIRYTKKDLAGEVEKITEIESTIFENLFKITDDWDGRRVGKLQRYNPKRRYWVWKGTHFLQFSQTNDSKNWDKDGLGNINLLSVHSFTATYQKNKWKVNQSLEWRLNLANNSNDTIRWYKVAEDKFRSYTTVGFQAFKNWFYSSNMEFTTQFVPNHIENKTDRVASFLSPFKVNTGLGMNYTLNKTYPNKTHPKLQGKKVVFTADISPLSIQYVNVMKNVANLSQFGIKEGSSLLDFGTTLNAKLTVNFSKSTSYMTRINYFTNYHKVYSEWEHDLNLPINRYFSMRLYFFATFDDTRTKTEKYGYIQIKETFSFGFNYTW
jgi:hypothetical protein